MRALPLLIVAIFFVSCARATTLTGTILAPNLAPDFTLTDALTERPLALSSLRGSVVALSFLYTNCPDVCPLTAEHFREAQKALGPDAARVQFVAVSVDPRNDTRESVRTFTADHRLTMNWAYLIGPQADLAAVWALYGIGSADNGTASVSHNDAIFLIDPRGRERVLVHADTVIDDLVSDLRVLAREGSG